MPQQNNALSSGTIINQYLISHTISSGGFSIVYLAFDRYKNPVVIKEFMPSSISLRDGTHGNSIVFQNKDDEKKFKQGLIGFFKESENIARLNSPYLISILDIFLLNNTAYLVMPYVIGTTLQTVILKHKEIITPDWLHKLTLELAAGFESLHDNKILHLDLKPSNIFIRPDDSPIIIDFGSCRIGFEKKYLPPMHTPGFAAPEQYLSEYSSYSISNRTDLYNFGATIYSCIESSPPMAAHDRIKKKNDGNVIDRFLKNHESHYHKNFLNTIGQLLEMNPDSRQPTIHSVIKSLTQFKNQSRNLNSFSFF